MDLSRAAPSATPTLETPKLAHAAPVFSSPDATIALAPLSEKPKVTPSIAVPESKVTPT